MKQSCMLYCISTLGPVPNKNILYLSNKLTLLELAGDLRPVVFAFAISPEDKACISPSRSTDAKSLSRLLLAESGASFPYSWLREIEFGHQEEQLHRS